MTQQNHTSPSELGQILDHLVQGVQEIPVKRDGTTKENLLHYYDYRSQWIELSAKKIKKLIAQAYLDGQIATKIQPLYLDEHGVIRFKENKIVRYLLDNGGIDMNKLAVLDFSVEDREQFAQLIGYSLSGYGELSYVTDESYDTADKSATQLKSGLPL